MWKELVQSLGVQAVFHAPISQSDLNIAQGILHLTLPDELKSLLFESDGISDEYEAGIIWPLDQIVEYNLNAWNDSYFKLQHPLSSLLFFADAGNGDWFGFPIANGQVSSPQIFVWDHEESSTRIITHSLEDYLTRWLRGTLNV